MGNRESQRYPRVAARAGSDIPVNRLLPAYCEDVDYIVGITDGYFLHLYQLALAAAHPCGLFNETFTPEARRGSENCAVGSPLYLSLLQMALVTSSF